MRRTTLAGLVGAALGIGMLGAAPAAAHGGGGASAGGSALASWTPATVLSAVFVLVVVALFAAGRPGDHRRRSVRFLLRAPNALEERSGLPGWAAATALLSLFGLLVAGIGFYSDVAYHIAFGRDEVLFTAPHVLIFAGLVLILVAAVTAIVVASLQQVRTGVRIGRVRVPWSAVPLAVIGGGAVVGFPVDEIWHRQYGVDVTMWSPPHLMMILGAACTGLASWFVIAESGARPRDGRWARGFHVAAAWLTLLGLSAPLGEFAFGVPQWQQLFHPVLLMLAAGLAVVPMRLVLGPGWALGIAAVVFVADAAGLHVLGQSPVATRPAGTFLGAALAVEVVARVWGVRSRPRFALLTGLGIGTLGLGVEWFWNAGAHQPWRAALLPDAVLVGVPAALAAAVLGTAIGAVLAREPVGLRGLALVGAGLAAVVVLAVPLPREVGEVEAVVTLEPVDADRVLVHARLDPPDAADDARWFTVGAWQGGGQVSAPMREVGRGTFRAARPVPVTGHYKSLLRLHRGAEMMAIPIRLPADPEIGEPELAAEDRRTAFVDEQQYLQREVAAHDAAGPAFRVLTVGLLALLAVGWVGAFLVAGRGLDAARVDGAEAPARPG